MKVISFSLWGRDPRYTVGALRNAELAPAVYPGWVCRFYCGATVPPETTERLAALPHVQVVRMPTPGDWRAMLWRFAPAAEADVEVMLSRDADSRLNARERAAVDAWLASDCDFHVMRDHPLHCVTILGGLWGVRNRLLHDLPALVAGFPAGDFYQVDQRFLDAVVAPRVRARWLEHDEYFARRPFPTPRIGRTFVGQPFDADDRPLAERPSWLAARVMLARQHRGPMIRLASRARTAGRIVARRGRHRLVTLVGRASARRTLPAPPQRCLVLQSDVERNDPSAARFRECRALQHAFRANGVETDVWGLRHENFAVPPDFDAYDLLFCAENYEWSWLPRLREIRRPLKVQWIIDLHFQGPRPYEPVSLDCDVILHSTRRLMADYERLVPGKRHLWFPNAVDARLLAPAGDVPKTRDVVFVGSFHPDRDRVLAELGRRVGVERLFATGDAMHDAVRSAKMHVNVNLGVDINFRTFETIALGTCLVTNADPDLAALGFEDGVNCLTYATVDEAAGKIAAALDDGRWRDIAARGRALAERHTYTRRVGELLATLVDGSASATAASARNSALRDSSSS